MAVTFEEFLRANGASDEDLKALVTPASRKAYDAMQSRLAESERLRQIAETDRQNFQNWYDKDALPAYEKMQRETVAARAEAAKAREAVIALQAQGLADIAKDLGYNEDGTRRTPDAPNPAAPAFDPAKYPTLDQITGFMDQAGDGLAALQDMVAEHTQLFPEQRLNVRELRKAAVAAKKNIVQFWEEKYNVPAARTAAETRSREAYEKKLRDEGAASARAELASHYGNPETRPLATSSSPWTPRSDRGRDKQPWERDENAAARDRVQHATTKVVESMTQNVGTRTN